MEGIEVRWGLPGSSATVEEEARVAEGVWPMLAHPASHRLPAPSRVRTMTLVTC